MLLLELSNKRICRQLGISENTVTVHMTAALRALGAENRTQTVLNAAQLGIRVPRVRVPSQCATPRHKVREKPFWPCS